MQTWQIIGIFIAVFAVIVGNIVLLKKTANMEFKKKADKAAKDNEHEDGHDKP